MTKKSIDKTPKKPSAVSRMIMDAKPISGRIILCSLMSLVSIAFSLVIPLITGQLIDLLNNFIKERKDAPAITLDMNLVYIYCGILLGCYLLSVFLSGTKMVVLNNTVSRYYTCTLRIKLSEKIKRVPVSFVDTTPNGEVISRMTHDVSVVGTTIHHFLDLMIVGVIQLVAIGIILFLYNWIIALIVILIVPILLVIAVILAQRSEKHFKEQHKLGGMRYSLIEESFTNFATVKCYNMEQSQNTKHDALDKDLTYSNYRGGYLSESVNPIMTFAHSISIVLICILGGYFAVNGTFSISVGSIVAIIGYARQIGAPLGSISNAFSMLQRTKASATRVYDLLDTPEMSVTDNPQTFNGNGQVVFENVDFSYTADPLITDLNLSLASKQKIAIVGPTGAGKTTLVNLLMRFYELNKGRILIDGVDISTIQRENVRRAFSMVLQDTWIFNGTIFDNVRYSKPDATREEVENACRLAHCDFFINSLPQGYDTVLNDDLTSISSGQKQLLTLARAFLSDSKILILDEATSNIDTRTELLIQAAMDNLMKGRTCFVIAHRLSTIIDADVILVLRDGKVVEQGTHKQLMELKGFYNEIYNSQYSLLAKINK